ncbi:glycosyltransferase [Butyrivibrio sp. NC2007]|uniref:glycosyltransferase n=1 Tax=Butyrivibrio sp. NC2007 TaxID=1280683 RepID=UPI0003B4C736|nr:glycosyltransferase [Butyrivibrio sp. NC2007]
MNKICIITRKLTGGGSERVFSLIANGFSSMDDCRTFILSGKSGENEYHLEPNVIRIEELCGNNIFRDAYTIVSNTVKHKFDVLIGGGFYCNICCCMAKLFIGRTKVVISERNDPKRDLISWRGRIARSIFFPLADGVVFQTQSAMDYYPKRISSRGKVIPNPIIDDLPQRIPTKDTIVSIGRLHPQKNYPMLIDAYDMVWTNNKSFKLVIYGSGSEKKRLVEYARSKKSANNIYFEDFCQDVHERIKNDKIFVLSSLFEGMPNALMEAMAMGFPVIATDTENGGCREIITDGYNGFLVGVNDVTQLAKKIQLLISDEDTREKIAGNARVSMKRYLKDSICAEWMDFVNNILQL